MSSKKDGSRKAVISLRNLAALWLILVATGACAGMDQKGEREISPSGIIKHGDVYRISFPFIRWNIEFPAEGLKIETVDTKRPYYFLTNSNTGLLVSFNFEASRRCNNSEGCRDYFDRKIKSNFPNRKNWSKFNVGEVYVTGSLNDRQMAAGMSPRQQNFNAHYVKDGIWVDMHLSKVSYQESDRKLFMDFIRSVTLKRNLTFSPTAEDYLGRGVFFRGWNDFDRAISAFNEYIRVKPNTGLGYKNRGMVHFRKKDYDRAISDYNLAIRFTPDDPFAYYERAYNHYLIGDHEKAVADYTSAIRLLPDHFSELKGNVFKERADAYRKLEMYPEAIGDYGKAIEIDPKLSFPFFKRGETYRMIAEYDRAIADFSAAISRKPNWAPYRQSRGETYMKMGKLDQACNDWRKAAELDPKIKIERLKEKCSKAGQRQVQTTPAQSAEVFFNQGHAYEKKGEYDQAIAEFSEAIRLNPSFHIAYISRGMAYEEIREPGRAIADYSEAIRLKADDHMGYFLRGTVHAGKNEYDRAIADFSEAIRLRPGMSGFYIWRGGSHGHMGDMKKACADWRKAADLGDMDGGSLVKEKC